jgi:peptidoglycan/LPS O-acetylase OafA/YrhL
MILSIQYLRAIAAMLVVFSHIAWKNMQIGGESINWWHTAGSFGVDIFFIISGFIMVFITHNRPMKEKKIETFLKKRFIRIVPLYWFYTLLALVIYLIIPERVNSGGGETEIVKSFFLLPLDKGQVYLLNVAWTLHYEFIFYILFAIGLFFSQKYRYVFVGLMILTSLIYKAFFVDDTTSYIIHSLASDIFFEFAMGMLLFFLIDKKEFPLVLSLASLIIGIMLFYFIFSGEKITYLYHLYTGVSAFLICFGVVSMERVWRKKEIKFLSKIGDASYTLYLLHPFVLVGTLMVYNKVTHFVPKSETLFIILMFLSAIVVSYVAYIVIEKNLIKITKKYLT